MVILLCFIGILIATFVLAFQSTKVYRKEQENRRIQAYMISLQSFHTMIQNRIESTRCYRHDLAKHIQTLELLMRQKDQPNLQEYAENLKIQFQELKSSEYCRDEVISTVILIKRQQCQEKKIPFSFEIADVDYGSVKDMDMVGLLYNLLDNALEANEKLCDNQERGIWLFMGREGGEIYIEVKNRISEDKKLDFRSEKPEKDEHGLGMKIIDYFVQKYNGEKNICIDEKEGIISIKVRLRADNQDFMHK